ncbi:MAG: hypothetical protein M1832_000386 [Thelocarpon impressellum]|nr:MAG: hypothetical protein M1832_000386 [Thelocarpon impressellum]
MATGIGTESLLRGPSDEEYPSVNRTPCLYNPLRAFELEKQKQYQQQYADIYFLRLTKLKPVVEEIAQEAWEGFKIAGEAARRVDRVLDVRQGELCWVTGTVYMDMPLKPNILDDIMRDQWISESPRRQKYISPESNDQVMLEDESGRVRLIGTGLGQSMLVTGCIIAVMGTENANGDFEVVDLKVPDLARQPQRWERDDIDLTKANAGQKVKASGREQVGKVAIVSGLGISGDEVDSLTVDLLMEYLLGEATSPGTQAEVGGISRLIIAGNSLAEAAPLPVHEDDTTGTRKTSKKYGYDSSAYNPAPTMRLDNLFASLLPTLPITLIPGQSDPANVALPQQPIHSAMFPRSRAYAAPPGELGGWFDSGTNPWVADVQGWRMLGTGGQPVDDIYKYVDGDDRLEMMEGILRWRICAPTAPDTLWCYPFQDKDPFVIEESPHVFFVGNQPRFDTMVIDGNAGQQVRLIAVPKFRETGEVVLLDLETLDVELLHIEVPA